MIAGWQEFAEVFVLYLVLEESSRVCYSYSHKLFWILFYASATR